MILILQGCANSNGFLYGWEQFRKVADETGVDLSDQILALEAKYQKVWKTVITMICYSLENWITWMTKLMMNTRLNYVHNFIRFRVVPAVAIMFQYVIL